MNRTLSSQSIQDTFHDLGLSICLLGYCRLSYALEPPITAIAWLKAFHIYRGCLQFQGAEHIPLLFLYMVQGLRSISDVSPKAP